VLLLDEPLGALDLKLRRQMQVELSRIHRQVGTTFVFVTHDQEEALSMATRIAVMSQGRVVQMGTPREIYYRPVSRFVADFIGESNFLTGTVERDGAGSRITFDGGVTLPVANGAVAGPATLMVRPEAVSIGRRDEAPSTALSGRIANVAFMGNHTVVTVETSAGAIVVHRSHRGAGEDDARSERPGEEASLWWPSELATIIGPE